MSRISAANDHRLAYRLDEAAKALGISPRWLYALARQGVVPCLKLGQGRRRVLLFPRAALEQWLQQSQESK